jgi:hypothetical protein
MTRVWITTGDAITPYTKVAEEVFHTEFGARLFGWLTCESLGEWDHYWNFKNEQ